MANTQSGAALVRKDKDSLRLLRADGHEQDYQQALAWRRRIRSGEISLSECTTEALKDNFDMLERAATAWRGMIMHQAMQP